MYNIFSKKEVSLFDEKYKYKEILFVNDGGSSTIVSVKVGEI